MNKNFNVFYFILVYYLLETIIICLFDVQSNLVNPYMRLSGNLLFGQNFSTPKFFIIPLHVSVRKCQKNSL